jgi:hypothetical protein
LNRVTYNHDIRADDDGGDGTSTAEDTTAASEQNRMIGLLADRELLPRVTYDQLQVPDQSKWGEGFPDAAGLDCSDKLGGSEEECSVQLNLRSLDDFLSMNPVDYRPYVLDLGDDFSSADSDVLLLAWGLLIENADLIRWAACWVKGKDDDGDAVVSKITSGAVELRSDPMDPGDDPGLQMYVKWPFDADNIWIQTGSESWWDSDLMPTWFCNGDGDEGRLCLAITVAVALLHEVTHLVGFAGFDNHPERRCEKSYMLENIFGWAMLQRYPSATAPCCTRYVNDGVFGYGGIDPENVTACRSSCSASVLGGRDAGGFGLLLDPGSGLYGASAIGRGS